MDSNKLLKLISLLCMLLILTACIGDPIRSWPVKTGRVLDIETNKPIEGAIVVAFWKGRLNIAFIDSQSTCYHVESTTSDKNGYYQIPVWDEGFSHGNIFNKYMTIKSFKTGYVRDEKSFTKESKLKGMQYQRAFKGTREERFKYLRWFPTSCHAAGDSDKNLYDVKKTTYEEARRLAKTKEEQRIVEFMLWSLEDIEYGYDEAKKRHYKRLGIRQ